MRCECCDRNLNDFESTRKSKVSGEYLNMCNKCVAESGVSATTREDLDPYEVLDEDLELPDEETYED